MLSACVDRTSTAATVQKYKHYREKDYHRVLFVKLRMQYPRHLLNLRNKIRNLIFFLRKHGSRPQARKYIAFGIYSLGATTEKPVWSLVASRSATDLFMV